MLNSKTKPFTIEGYDNYLCALKFNSSYICGALHYCQLVK